MKKLALVLFMTGCFLSLCAQDVQEKSTLTIFLVRHAEKAANSRDPELSPEGRQRAVELAQVLEDTEIDQIHSTDYIRTRETARPAAVLFQKEIKLYAPGKLEDFAEELKKAGGRHLVVGHSNTTPQLVRLLGGAPGKPIVEEGEYDRLYILSGFEKDKPETVLIRYGKKFVGAHK